MTEKLNNPKFNIILIFIFEIIGCAISFSANYDNANSLSGVLVKWIPALIGLTTIIFYFGSTFFIKKRNWIITLIGIVLILIAAAKIYSGKF